MNRVLKILGFDFSPRKCHCEENEEGFKNNKRKGGSSCRLYHQGVVTSMLVEGESIGNPL